MRIIAFVNRLKKMRFTVCGLTKIIKKSCRRYLIEREYPPTTEIYDTDSDQDYYDPSTFPIEELQEQIHHMLCEYRDYISIFSEKCLKLSTSKNLNTRNYEGFEVKSNRSKKRKMSQDCRLGYGKNLIKNQSIFSGSFGNYKPGNNFSIEDMDRKISEDQFVKNKSSSEEKSEGESIMTENNKIRWVPNDAYKSCQLCQTEFSLFFRRHHCRNCGIIVCDDCSPHKEYVSGYRDEKVRVCKTCYTHFCVPQSDAISYGK